MNTTSWVVKDIESGEVMRWTLTDILNEINRDRSDDWTPYNASDWREGWDQWCEDYTYTIIYGSTVNLDMENDT